MMHDLWQWTTSPPGIACELLIGAIVIALTKKRPRSDEEEEKLWMKFFNFAKRRIKLIITLLVGYWLVTTAWSCVTSKAAEVGEWAAEQRALAYQPTMDERKAALVEEMDWTGERERFPAKFTATIPAGIDPQWAFAGLTPPNSLRNVRISPEISEDGPLNSAYLVDGEELGGKPKPLAILKAASWNGRSKSTSVYPLPQLPFNDDIGNSSQAAVAPLYVQVDGRNGKSSKLEFEHEAGNEMQWLVALDGADCASFTVPKQGWKHLWIVPIWDEEFLSKFDGLPMPVEGLSMKGLLKTFRKPDRTDLKTESMAMVTARMLPHSIDDVAFQGIYYQVGGNSPSPLAEAMTFSNEMDLRGEKIVLGINSMPGKPLRYPARILVGISTD